MDAASTTPVLQPGRDGGVLMQCMVRRRPRAYCFNCKSPLYTEREGAVCDSCYGYFNALHLDEIGDDE